ncbi:MAG TPA: hypothetical protein VF285_00885 [Castellaniella sp.]|uniref:hypothetical protein n=1 Tax=Castellaniella sp. TaxID=1955812 RepID=UPI002F0C172D
MNNASTPFRVTGALAIIGAGLIAAAIAYRPTMPLVWMVAYLVLVTGVVQYVLGSAQAALAVNPPRVGTLWAEWVLLNLGHAGVIGGTLTGNFGLLIAGTIFYDLAMILFGWSVRAGTPGPRRVGYWLLILAMIASSLIGISLTLAKR